MSEIIRFKINFSWNSDDNNVLGTDVSQIEIRYRRVGFGEIAGSLSWEVSKWLNPSNIAIVDNGDNYYNGAPEQYYIISVDVENCAGIEFIYRGKDSEGNTSLVWSNGGNGSPVPNEITIEVEPNIIFSDLTSPTYIDLTLPISPILDNALVVVGGLTGPIGLVSDIIVKVKDVSTNQIITYIATIDRVKKYWTSELTLFQGNNEITLSWTDSRSNITDVEDQSLSLFCDTFSPIGSIVINEGQSYTTNSKVLVKFEVSDISDITDYRILDSLEELELEDWKLFPVDGIVEFDLVDEEGTSILFAQCRDKWNHVSTIMTSSIIFDNTSPEVTINNLVPQIRTSLPITITGNAVDNISGVDYVEILIMNSENRIFNGEYWHPAEYWIRVSGKENWLYNFNYNEHDVYRIWIRACDNVGNLKNVNINSDLHNYVFSYGIPTIYVGNKIQNAIDAVLMNGTVIVLDAKTYIESFDINSDFSIILRGQGADKTIIESSNSEYICDASGSKDCVIENICFNGVELPNNILGIILGGTANNVVKYCLLKYLDTGLTTGYKATNYDLNHITAVKNRIAFQLSSLDAGVVSENILWKNVFGVKVI